MDKEIYLQRFRERIGAEDTSANSKKLRTHLLLKSYQFLKEGELLEQVQLNQVVGQVTQDTIPGVVSLVAQK